jgi:hypothetical protein
MSESVVKGSDRKIFQGNIKSSASTDKKILNLSQYAAVRSRFEARTSRIPEQESYHSTSLLDDSSSKECEVTHTKLMRTTVSISKICGDTFRK